MIGRLVLAAFLGCLVGFERERRLRAAGLRTHMLVALGAALIMIVSAYGFADVLGTPNVVLDPSRVAAQVVSGIGFLGAGTILVRRQVIRGLTTAASLWAVAAIGLAVGGGLYLAGGAATALILVILVLLKPVERRIARDRHAARPLIVRIDTSRTSPAAIEAALARSAVPVRTTETRAPADAHQEMRVVVTASSNDDVAAVVNGLRMLPGVDDVRAEGEQLDD